VPVPRRRPAANGLTLSGNDRIGRFRVERHRAAPSVLHALEIPEPVEPTVWVLSADRPGLVLGSTQDAAIVDTAAAARLGVEIARRRSGGAAVYVDPAAMTWVDIIVPHGDPRWSDDVGVAFEWVGELWLDALRRCGIADASVHRGPMVTTPWSPLVCFAGRGPGEVVQGDAKLVGISQRRTRGWARFQCAALLEWRVEPYLELLIDTHGRRDAEVAMGAVGASLGLDHHTLLGALLASLAAV